MKRLRTRADGLIIPRVCSSNPRRTPRARGARTMPLSVHLCPRERHPLPLPLPNFERTGGAARSARAKSPQSEFRLRVLRRAELIGSPKFRPSFDRLRASRGKFPKGSGISRISLSLSLSPKLPRMMKTDSFDAQIFPLALFFFRFVANDGVLIEDRDPLAG